MSVLTPVLCAIAALFLLLVSISVPIVKSIYLFSFTTTTSPPLRINFGVWGYCFPTNRYSLLGIYRSTPASCSSPHLGWHFDGRVASYLGAATKLDNAISTATTIAFVLHPVATALALLTLILSLFLLRPNPPPFASFSTFAFGILAALLSTIAFLIDIIALAILKPKIRTSTNSLVHLTYGNAVWLTLIASVALWFAIFAASFAFFQRRRQSKSNAY